MNRNRLALILSGAALIAVCGLCALTGYGTYAWFNSRQANLRFFDFMNVSAQVTESKTYEAKPTLILDSDSGDITILPGEGTEIEVEMVKTGWGTDQAEAEKAANAIQVAVQETGQTLKFTYTIPEEFGVGISRGGQDSVDFVIRVPAETVLEITGGFGDISVTGLTENVMVETHFGDLTVSDVEAGENPIRLVTSFGDLTVENAQGTEIYLESSNGTITGTDLSATDGIEVANTFGDLHLEGLTAATLTVNSQNGTVEVYDGEVEGNLTVTNSFGDIDIRNLEATSYSIESQNGKVVVDGASGLIKISNSFGDIEVTNGVQATLDLGSENGKVTFSGTLNPETEHQLHNSFGDITLTVPEGSAFDLKLETSFGEINSEIPVTLTGTLEQTAWEAEMNGGGPLITATTSNGNITLQTLVTGE